jgi:hypothetical protein
MPANHWSNDVGDRVRVWRTAFSQSSLGVKGEEVEEVGEVTSWWSRDIDITIHTLSTCLWKKAEPQS